jgi:hypothetical protein
MHRGRPLCGHISMRIYGGVVCHTGKGKQLVRDEDGRVVLAPVEGFLAPFAKVLLHSFVIAWAKVCSRELVYVISMMSPVVVAVGGGARCCSRDRDCHAKAHVPMFAGVPAAAGRLSQPGSCLHPDLSLSLVYLTNHNARYNTHHFHPHRTTHSTTQPPRLIVRRHV